MYNIAWWPTLSHFLAAFFLCLFSDCIHTQLNRTTIPLRKVFQFFCFIKFRNTFACVGVILHTIVSSDCRMIFQKIVRPLHYDVVSLCVGGGGATIFVFIALHSTWFRKITRTEMMNGCDYEGSLRDWDMGIQRRKHWTEFNVEHLCIGVAGPMCLSIKIQFDFSFICVSSDHW